jgi:Cu+-exporting ATPase
MAIMVGTGRGAREGVLISNAEALELLKKIDTLVVDKTGTLTQGRPKVTELIAAEGVTDAELLQAAASLEKASEHPLAAAILAAAKEKNIDLVAIDGFLSVTGKGVKGNLNGKQVAIGNAALMTDFGASPESLRTRAEALQTEGRTVMYIALGRKFAGLIAVADPIKDSTPETIEKLKREASKSSWSQATTTRLPKQSHSSLASTSKPMCCLTKKPPS